MLLLKSVTEIRSSVISVTEIISCVISVTEIMSSVIRQKPFKNNILLNYGFPFELIILVCKKLTRKKLRITHVTICLHHNQMYAHNDVYINNVCTLQHWQGTTSAKPIFHECCYYADSFVRYYCHRRQQH